MKKIRFTIGTKQLFQLEKSRRALFRVKETEYEVVLADNVEVQVVPNEVFDAEKAAKFVETNKSKMN